MRTARGSGERVQQKGRTRSALLAAAVRLLTSGVQPSVADVADASAVSRRTAYRYFPTQEQMLVEAALEGVRGIMAQAIEHGDGKRRDPNDVEARLDRAVRALQRSAVDNEQLLRTMIRLTVSSPESGARGGVPVRKRGYRRIEWIALALAPVKQKLGKRRYERLVSALAMCVGIEALIVLRDLRGLPESEAEEVSRWAARTLLRESLDEARPHPQRKR
ncbi:MAG: TetR/AcrR family transcriptional regulator [Gemmatimonadota bacterium]|nr:TetR/AcrR family transcriptional regulator [Gemmatimonadota bacterium]